MFAIVDRLPVFDGLTQEELSLLNPLLERFSCEPGTTVIQQGAPAEYLYLVISGMVEIVYKPYDAPAITVTHVMPNGVFGWSAAIGSDVYTSSAVSIDSLKAIRIRGMNLRELCMEHPETGKVILDRLANVVSSRWRNAHAQVTSLLNHGMDGESASVETPVRPNHTVEEHLKGLIEQLSAYVEQYHGGTINFVSFDGRVLTVRLGGACLGCPLVPATLHGWVAGTVHQFFPDIKVVSAE